MKAAYIEYDDRILSPLDADLAVLRIGNVLVEKAEESITFFILEADDVCSVCEQSVNVVLAKEAREARVASKDAQAGLTKRHFSPVIG